MDAFTLLFLVMAPVYNPVSEVSVGDKNLIEVYFRQGYKYNEVLHMLSTYHDVNISIRQLHRILRKQGLYRKGKLSDLNQIITFVERQLRGSGECIGYRQMHQRCVRTGFRVSQDSIRIILKELDPDGVEARKKHYLKRREYYSKGPNWAWHVDGYDKLKPFGFNIHGAIDGYSRRILWLEILKSNKDPVEVLSLYSRFIGKLTAVPRKVVADRGTENVLIAGCQRFTRRLHTDNNAAYNSFQYGKSISNQRIEALWSHLRRSCTHFWINFFKDLIEAGQFDFTNPIEKELVTFVFFDLLKRDLNTFQLSWNVHAIRPSAYTDPLHRLSGRPNVLYFTPELSHPDAKDYKCNLDIQDYDVIKSIYGDAFKGYSYCCSYEFFELATILMGEHNLTLPTNALDGVNLYQNLLQIINNI